MFRTFSFVSEVIDFFRDFLIIGGLTLIIVGGIFAITMLISSKKHEKEKGLQAIYSERCGARIGLVNFTFPFVRLAFYKDYIMISSWSKTIIAYDQIKRLEDTGFLFSGIEIVTNDIDHYGQPVIWTFNTNRVIDLIEKGRKGSL